MFRSRGGGGSQHSVRDHRIRGAVAAIRLGDGKAKDGVRPLWLLDVSGWVLFFFFFFSAHPSSGKTMSLSYAGL